MRIGVGPPDTQLHRQRMPSYTHGHHESVLRSHRWRTVENSAAYLASHLRPGLSLLDVGCGPGTITADFAARLAPGNVLGIDTSPDVIAAAKRDYPEVSFATDDLYQLDTADASWDIVHAHQVLERRWWGGLWADRMTTSAIAQQAVREGRATADELASIADAWRAWSAAADGWFAVLHGEIICTAP